MAVRSVADVVECYDAGRFRVLPMWRKNLPVPTSIAGWYMDGAAFSAGTPSPNFYAATPRVFAPMGRAADGGWDHGGDVAPSTKYLKRLCYNVVAFTATARLVDVLGFYPFFDESVLDEEQVTDNDNPKPARLRDGDGVGIYLVQQFANQGATPVTVSVRYLSSDGVERTTTPVRLINDAAIAWPAGAILQRSADIVNAPTVGPWLTLAQGDRGVREVRGVTITGTPDTGLFAVVMARTVADLPTMHGYAGLADAGQGRAWVEHDFMRTTSRLPVIDDDAFLSFLVAQSAGTASYPHYATGEVIWR